MARSSVVRRLSAILVADAVDYTGQMRRDENVFSAFGAQMGEQLAHQDVPPEAVFARQREPIIYGNAPRRRPLQP